MQFPLRASTTVARHPASLLRPRAGPGRDTAVASVGRTDAPRGSWRRCGASLFPLSVFPSLLFAEYADFKGACLSSEPKDPHERARSVPAMKESQMPLFRGLGLPPLTQVDGVHFAL